MVETNTIVFLVIVTIGAMVQTITGFAMGLMIIAGVAVFAITDIAFAAAVVSFISLVNAAVALRRGYRHVQWHYVKWILAGLLPCIVVGLVLLELLSDSYYELLRMFLGLVIMLAGCLLMISPRPFEQGSGPVPVACCGALGGVLAGMYSAGGAPLAYFMYRQPLEIDAIRFSLLAVFGVTTLSRSVLVGLSGQLSADILLISALSIPLVILSTVVTTRFVPLIPDRAVRVLVFFVLLLAGGFLVYTSLQSSGYLAAQAA